ncbi:LacI family DNA-binding transcriptional regulator [Gluconobacter sp. Dm-62]|uniref:LacI family DNA-binding transcriptional regulator n=1 Tax=Gluconobacter sp. Dm-62 TaxID=2799804 RepID=UPI001B8C68BC|nr:LacI family DNA-binding transcriptional regulator [Gluconobacter sp. Dm-62]MBS1101422.1 LacI family DNA-binding transcriptional regulator [Gluconobacter sp. Dm-62]
MSRRIITSIDVARHAGVSQSAVSRAFSSNASISPVTRAKVFEAAAALNYRPNRIPAIMLSGRSGMIGVVVGGLSNPFYAFALECLTVSLRAAGFQIMLVHVDDALILDAALDQLASYRVDAIITALAVGTPEAARCLSELNIPAICFNSRIVGPGISTIRSNNSASGFRAARIMQECGVVRPVWLGGPVRNAASRERRRGFLGALATDNGTGKSVTELQGDDTYESGFTAVREYLRQGHRPDGLFCSNDLMACGALDAFRDHGILSCPEDVVVIGYDNIPQGAWQAYQLTTFSQNLGAFAEVAIEILTEVLSSPDVAISQKRMIDAELLVRGSTMRKAPVSR